MKSAAALALFLLAFSLRADTPKAAGVPPSVTVQPIGRIASADGHVALSINATGQAPLSVQWFRNAQPLTNDARITGADQFVLNLDPALTNDTGNYFAIVTNAAGAATSAVASVTVHPIGFNVTVVPGVGLRLRINSRIGDVCRIENSAIGTPPWTTNGYATNVTGTASYLFLFGSSGGGVIRAVFDHMLPQLTPPARTDSTRAIAAYGKLNQVWKIQGTTNFTAWTDLAVVTNSTGTFLLTNQPAPLPAHRFYRLVPP